LDRHSLRTVFIKLVDVLQMPLSSPYLTVTASSSPQPHPLTSSLSVCMNLQLLFTDTVLFACAMCTYAIITPLLTLLCVEQVGRTRVLRTTGPCYRPTLSLSFLPTFFACSRHVSLTWNSSPASVTVTVTNVNVPPFCRTTAPPHLAIYS